MSRPSIYEAPFQLPVVINHHLVAWIKNNHFIVSHCFCGSGIWEDLAEQFWLGLYLDNDRSNWGLTGAIGGWLASLSFHVDSGPLHVFSPCELLRASSQYGIPSAPKSRVLSEPGGSSINFLKKFILFCLLKNSWSDLASEVMSLPTACYLLQESHRLTQIQRERK